MDAIAKRVLYYNVVQNKLYNDNGDFMGNTQFNVFFDNVTSVELHYMADTNGNNVSDWVPWTALSGKPVGSSICFDDDYVHAKLGQVYETCAQGSSQIKVTVNLQEQNINFSDVLIVHNEDGSSDSYPYSSYSYENGVYTFDLQSTVSESIIQGQSVRVPQALLLKVNSQDIDNSNASVGIFTFKIKSLSNKLLNRLDYSNTRLISGTFQHQIYSDGRNIATFTFPMSVSNLMDYHGQANVPKDGTWADKAYVDSKINSNAIVEQTDPIYSADKPNIALKSELFSRKFQDLIDAPNTVQGFGLTDLSLTDRTVSIGGNSVDVPLMNKSTIIQALGGDQMQGDTRMFLNARGQFSYAIKSVNGRVPDQLGNISLNIESITTLDTLREQLGVICEVNGIVPQDSRRSITLDGSNIYVDPHDADEAILLNDYLLNTVQTVNEITPESGNITLSAQNIPFSNEYSTVAGCLNYILQQLQSSGGQSGGGTVKSVMGFTPDGSGQVTLSTSAFSVDGYTQSMTYQDAFRTISSRLQEIGSGGGSSQEYNFVYPLQLNGSDVSIDLTEYALKTELFSKSFNDLTNKPTTLAGYGITDAYISGRTITIGGNSITVPESSGGSGDYTLTKEAVDGVIGASTAGSTAKFYNEQGAFTEVDMSGYLPLSGGTITGDLNITGSSVDINLNNGTDGTSGSFSVYVPRGLDDDFGTPLYHSIQMASDKIYAIFKSTTGWQFKVIDQNTNITTSYIYNYHNFIHIYNQNSVGLAAGEDNEIMVSLQSDDRYERVSIRAPNGAVINDVQIATVNDISTHNTDTMAHTNLFALKVDVETYNTAITAINTALEGKENTGVAQGLVDAHATVTASSDTLGHIKVDNDTITVDENGVATAHAVGHNIFDIFYSMSSKAPAGAMDLSLGTLIASCDTVFPDFWSECVARKAEGSIRTLTEEEWQAEAAANGSCGAFVVDEEAKSVRLPKITKMIQPGDVGMFTEAGLPNITGSLSDVSLLTGTGGAGGNIDGTTFGSGALTADGHGHYWNKSGTDNRSYITFKLDASKSNSIYGNSTTVQPPAVGAKLYIQVFTSAVPASMAQAGEFINMLETKADRTDLESYLPLSGGTMTGGVLYERESAVSGSTTANSITVNGGQGWGFGGSIAVYGSTHETRAGQVIIRAYDGTDEKRLEVRPDGTFNFDGQSVLNPPGTVIAFAGNSAPAGYLICNGAAVSRATYAKLFAIIGTTYGEGNGSTTFNLPNLTNKFIMGSSTAGTSKAAGLPNIVGGIGSPDYIFGQNMSGAFYSSALTSTGGKLSSGSTARAGNIGFRASDSNSIYGNSTTVQPPALTMRFYIKY